jgi:hypothetical protein
VTVLIRAPNIQDPDGFYAELIATHNDLSDAESTALNARLILILANHIGDRSVLSEALATARNSSVRGQEAEKSST